jgi:Fe2+ or Zn2+ uptake regulation protein
LIEGCGKLARKASFLLGITYLQIICNYDRVVYMPVEEILKERGYKLTKPRLAVLQLLKGQKTPLSAREIFKELKQKYDLVSIYRTLKILEKAEIPFAELINGEKKYHLSQGQHHHIICERCGRSECIPCHHLFNKIKNFTNIRHQLTLTGVCNKCNN